VLASGCTVVTPLHCQVVVKSQILAGGRGLGKFTNGLQGGVHIVHADKAMDLAKQMLGETLVTKQSGPAGKPVNTLYIAKKMKLAREMYFAILLDRKTAGPVIIACSEGGTSIEDLAEKYPEKIIKVPVDIRTGLTDAQAATVVDGLQVRGDKNKAQDQIKALYKLFTSADCTMVEVRSCFAHCSPSGRVWCCGHVVRVGDASMLAPLCLLAPCDALRRRSTRWPRRWTAASSPQMPRSASTTTPTSARRPPLP
jgi:succinyl-CoA synthetase beta subunit